MSLLKRYSSAMKCDKNFFLLSQPIMIDDDYGQKTVSVLLNEQETDLEVIDHPACEMSVSSFTIYFLFCAVSLKSM